MVREKLNWRSLADETVARTWNFPATPAFYVIDHQGVIRHKWIGHPGEKLINDALNELIQVVEKEDGQE